uniref:Secretory carrier-associated membrane protein n=1 Tax=Sphenodon punctatus TaxID=8508 RepID=A0A8D0LAL1_SPHPU
MARSGGERVEPDNPFQDPAVAQHRPTAEYATLDVYNPFENTEPPPLYHPQPPAQPTPPAPSAQPPRKPSPTEPRNYGSYGTQESAAAAAAELLKRQEELNRKAEELDRRERELRDAALGSAAARQNNWPPLPAFCPVKPCFYQDIAVEIPTEVQKTVSTMYYLWMASTGGLFLNFLASLAWFCVNTSTGSGFGLSILWALLFTPCSFVCWYRPMYKAFRSDSSFNFFVFFFIFFVQDVVYVLQAIGIPGWGFSGWILSLTALKENTAVAVLMILVAMLFTAVAVLMLKRVSAPPPPSAHVALLEASPCPEPAALSPAHLTPAFSCRSTPCTAAPAPASRRRRRNLPPVSSPTRRCARPQPMQQLAQRAVLSRHSRGRPGSHGPLSRGLLRQKPSCTFSLGPCVCIGQSEAVPSQLGLCDSTPSRCGLGGTLCMWLFRRGPSFTILPEGRRAWPLTAP